METDNGEHKHTCEDYGQEYANRRNLKRHRNQRHDEEVKFVRCPISECRRHFFRPEYVILHLEWTTSVQKKAGKEVYIAFGQRDELEIENKRFRTETSEEAAQDTTVIETANYLGGLPGVSEISECQYRIHTCTRT